MSRVPADPPPDPAGETVSRRRYERERRARMEAEALLEAKSRELFAANENLERLVAERTAELTSALAAAEEAGAMRARFLAVMSHEIRTPLAGLFGMLHLLRDSAAPGGTRDLIEAAAHSADSLKRIVDDVLDLSALDAGRMRFESEPVDLRALVNGVFALLGPRAAAKGLALSVSIAGAVPARLLGDATRLRQVLSNLCENAVKFSDRGAIALRAEMVEDDGGGNVLRVSVSDEGPGIAEADLPQLFKDFGQLDSGLTKRAEGTGLGLSICRRIVEGIGGRIGVESVPGRGSSFWFEIPARRAAPGADHTGATAVTVPEVPGSLQGRCVLVAEDNPINRKVIGGYLKLLDAAHDFAVDGAEAVRLAHRRRYDLILMDLAMPEMDGVSATIAIRAGNGPSCRTPVIAFTAHVMPSVRAECAAAGMVEVLAKPIRFDEFAATLARHAGAPEPAAASSMDAAAEAESVRRDLAAEFRNDTRQRIGLIRAALSRGDRAAVAAEVHRIRGASGLVGASGVHEIATALEEGAQLLDAEDVREALSDLAAEVDAFAP